MGGTPWSSLHGSCVCIYLYNRCLSPFKCRSHFPGCWEVYNSIWQKFDRHFFKIIAFYKTLVSCTKKHVFFIILNLFSVTLRNLCCSKKQIMEAFNKRKINRKMHNCTKFNDFFDKLQHSSKRRWSSMKSML